MTTELPRKKKLAHIIRAEVTDLERQGVDSVPVYGEAWAAIDDDENLITVGTDIAAVTQAARFAGFWIADQPT